MVTALVLRTTQGEHEEQDAAAVGPDRNVLLRERRVDPGSLCHLRAVVKTQNRQSLCHLRAACTTL